MTQLSTNKPMGLGGQVLFILCAVLILDTLTAAAALGTGVIGWWLITLAAFVVPYALIATDLGTAYPSAGGLYDWVRRAFGNRMAARTSWLYWINVGLWMPAVYILFAGMFAELFLPQLPMLGRVALCLLLIWLTVWFCNIATDIGVRISQIGAALKILVILVLGSAGFIHALQHGLANQLTLHSMLPSLEGGIGFLPAIIYNLLGLELVVTLGRQIKDPARSLPRAMCCASVLIAALYLFGTLGILAALPVEQIGLVAGLTDALRILLVGLPYSEWWVASIGILSLLTLIGNMVSWTMGSSRTAAEAAHSGELPRWLGYTHPRFGTPVGANVLTGTVASIVILCYALLAQTNDELFWTVFAFSSSVFLLPYLLLFAAYLKLRLPACQEPQPIQLPGGRMMVVLMSGSGLLFVSGALLLFLFPTLAQWQCDWQKSGPLLLGLMFTLLLGELLLWKQGALTLPRLKSEDPA
ncbi:MAG: APC family permease [Aeromonadaceae bacterium]